MVVNSLFLFIWKAFLRVLGSFKIFGTGQIQGHKNLLQRTIFSRISWRSMVHLIGPSSHPWVPEGQHMEKRLQAGGGSFENESCLRHLCLFPYLIKMGEVWLFYPGSGPTTKGHSGDKSSIRFFPEEQKVSLHVKWKTHVAFSIFWGNTHSHLRLSLVVLSKRDHPLQCGNQRLGSLTILRTTLLVSPGARVFISSWGLLPLGWWYLGLPHDFIV